MSRPGPRAATPAMGERPVDQGLLPSRRWYPRDTLVLGTRAWERGLGNGLVRLDSRFRPSSSIGHRRGAPGEDAWQRHRGPCAGIGNKVGAFARLISVSPMRDQQVGIPNNQIGCCRSARGSGQRRTECWLIAQTRSTPIAASISESPMMTSEVLK
jgi:hypothetical protein